VRLLIDAGLDDLAISVQVLGEREHSCRGTAMPFQQYYQRVMDAVRLIRQCHSPMNVTLCFMNTSTIKYFDIDRFMRLNGNRRAIESKLAPFLVDVYAAIGKPAPLQSVQAEVRKLNLLHPQMLRLDRHTTVYAQPFADWGNAFTSRRVHGTRFGYCGYGMKNIGVLNSGEVTICCADYDGRTALGNLHSDSLAAILSSERAGEICEGFRTMRLVHPHCRHCVGSPSRAKALLKGLGSIYLFRLLKFQPAQARDVLLSPQPALSDQPSAISFQPSAAGPALPAGADR